MSVPSHNRDFAKEAQHLAGDGAPSDSGPVELAPAQLLQPILDSIGEGIVAADASGKFTIFNRAAKRILGVGPVDSSPDRWPADYGLYLPDGETPCPTNEIPLVRGLGGEFVDGAELFLRNDARPDGVWLTVSVRPVYEGGSIAGAVAVFRDITHQKRMESERLEALVREQCVRVEVEQARNWYRLLADAIPQIVWTSLPDGLSDYCNRQWYEYTGLSPEQSAGEGWITAMHPDDVEECVRCWRESVAEDKPFGCEYRLLRASDGAYRWHLARAVSLHDENGSVVRWFGAATDIHDRRCGEVELASAMEALRASERALQEMNQDLQQFAFVASHDLQEPLRMVSSYSELLRRRLGGRDPETEEFISYILDGGKRMHGLIRDLLDFSRYGFEETRPGNATPLDVILRWALSNLQIAIQESGAVVTCEVLPTVTIDQTQMVQVFQNLISNAIKYRSAQPPRIVISSRQDGDFWVIRVTDNGIGFDPAYATQIFGIFKRLHGRTYPGTGIGLAICKRIVER
ncbi:MAG: PAS domain S-box protein, partial [Bryobacteraceae bacterium]